MRTSILCYYDMDISIDEFFPSRSDADHGPLHVQGLRG